LPLGILSLLSGQAFVLETRPPGVREKGDYSGPTDHTETMIDPIATAFDSAA
jgi:hypothetical protein